MHTHTHTHPHTHTHIHTYILTRIHTHTPHVCKDPNHFHRHGLPTCLSYTLFKKLIWKLRNYFIFYCGCVYVCVCACVSMGVYTVKEKELYSLELELQSIVMLWAIWLGSWEPNLTSGALMPCSQSCVFLIFLLFVYFKIMLYIRRDRRRERMTWEE